MLLIGSGLLLFFLAHSLRELGLRSWFIAVMPSVTAYRGVCAVLSLLALALLVYGKSQSEFFMVWQPRFEQQNISHLLMLPALILVVAGNAPMGYLRHKVRNPMLLGTVLWGVAHLWANGDVASMMLFGGFTLWALFKFVTLGRDYVVAGTPSARWDMLSVVVGLVLYAVLAIYHGQLFGVGLNFV